MRLRVAVIAVAMGCCVAGNALAADATRVIYDLSSLRASPALAAAPAARSVVQVPSQALPIASPSLGERQFGDETSGVGDLDQLERRHGTGYRRATGPPSAPPGRGPDPGGNPIPNPEPGSMLLLGGALASAIRFLRRH